MGIGYGPTSSPHENCYLETVAAVRMCPEIRPKHSRSIRWRREKDEEEKKKKETENMKE